MHLGMVVLMNASIGLEDPFATDGVDGIFVDEVLYEVQQVQPHLQMYVENFTSDLAHALPHRAGISIDASG